MGDILTRLDKEYAVINKISFADMRDIIEKEIAMEWEVIQNYESFMGNQPQYSTVKRNIEDKNQPKTKTKCN